MCVLGRYRTGRGLRSQWTTLRVFSADQLVTSVTLYQLRPNTHYDMMVLARNRVGKALFSDAITVRTTGQWPTHTVIVASFRSISEPVDFAAIL